MTGTLKLTVTIDEEVILSSTYNKSVHRDAAIRNVMEMLAVELAIILVRANDNIPDE